MLSISTLFQVETFGQTRQSINVIAFSPQALNLIWLKWRKRGKKSLILFYIHREENRNLSSEIVLTFWQCIKWGSSNAWLESFPVTKGLHMLKCLWDSEFLLATGIFFVLWRRKQRFPLCSGNLGNWITQNFSIFFLFFTETSVEAVHRHARLSIWTCLMEELYILRMDSLGGAERGIQINLLITWVKEENLGFKNKHHH